MNYEVLNVNRGKKIGSKICVAGTSKLRKKGLLGAHQLDPGAGLWIAPCEAVHTFGMKMAIDVVFLDKAFRVKKLIPNLRPWRMAASLSARSVLELAPGTIAESGTQIGDILRFSPL